ncbi:MAG: hypothetical protein JNK21_12355, partial [Rhodospirillaceae bacterium]|nr:hypothetical protein [Rhodospirillaceae bacterium]
QAGQGEGADNAAPFASDEGVPAVYDGDSADPSPVLEQSTGDDAPANGSKRRGFFSAVKEAALSWTRSDAPEATPAPAPAQPAPVEPPPAPVPPAPVPQVQAAPTPPPPPPVVEEVPAGPPKKGWWSQPKG